MLEATISMPSLFRRSDRFQSSLALLGSGESRLLGQELLKVARKWGFRFRSRFRTAEVFAVRIVRLVTVGDPSVP